MLNPRLVAKPLAQFITPCSRASLYLAPARVASFTSTPAPRSMGLFKKIFTGPPSPGTMADAKIKAQDLIDNNPVGKLIPSLARKFYMRC